MVASPLLRASFVLAAMAALTAHVATGFVYDWLNGTRIAPILAFDAALDRTVIAHMGRDGAVALLACLSLVATLLVYRRGLGEQAAAFVVSGAFALSEAAAQRLSKIASMKAPTPAPSNVTMVTPADDEDIIQAIAASAVPAISVRRQLASYTDWESLSFFGGKPIAPPNFVWPRREDEENGATEPLTFMAQIACADIPAAAGAPRLPASGVLYFFADLQRRTQGSQSVGGAAPFVVWLDGPLSDWEEAEPPADAPPCYGERAGEAFGWIAEGQSALGRYPIGFQKWPIDLGVVETYPRDAPRDHETADGQRRAILREQMACEAYGVFHGAPPDWAALEPPRGHSADAVWRPFAKFPHIWLAAEMSAGFLLAEIRRERLRLTRMMSEPRNAASDLASIGQAQLQTFNEVSEEAHAWIKAARAHGLMMRLSEKARLEFWAWLDRRADSAGLAPIGKAFGPRGGASLINAALTSAATLSAEAALAHGKDSGALIPQGVIDLLRARHAVVSSAGGRLILGAEHQMLGAGKLRPDGVPDDHILLLQLDNDPALYWRFGETGACQYWIGPEDLEAGRFARAAATIANA